MSICRGSPERVSKAAGWVGIPDRPGRLHVIVGTYGILGGSPHVKAATGVMIGAGLLAKNPLQGMSFAIALARSKL